jgi:GrpB-like predicted nucleotidyltransferase (UPF0157 family)
MVRIDVTTVEIIGGPEAIEVELQRYDDRWAAVYLEHRRRIVEALVGGRIEVEHIGSTSVPGLAAKPIIDIVVSVDDITAEADYLGPLLAAGYRLRVREPGHRLVRTPRRDVHVHLYQRGDPAVPEYLLLRDRLRTDAADRDLYERTKRDLLSRAWDDMNDYADAKTEVITAIKERARRAASAPAGSGKGKSRSDPEVCAALRRFRWVSGCRCFRRCCGCRPWPGRG